MLKKLTFVLAVALITFVACKKKSDTPAPSNSALLTARAWKLTDLQLNGTSLWSLSDTCEQDAKFTFNSNGTYSYSGCSSTDSDVFEDSTSGHWAFLNSSETTLIFHPKATDADTLQLSITSATLKLSQTASGITETEVYTGQ